MKYKIENLDYIYIRVQDSKGHWDSASLNEITDEQFLEWIGLRFGIKIKDDKNAKGTAWTPEQKVAFLDYMSKRLNAPCVCMIKRTMRDKLTK